MTSLARLKHFKSLIFVSLACLFLFSCNFGGHNHSTERFSGTNGSFPPQPTKRENVRALPKEGGLTLSNVDSLADSRVLQALGSDYIYLGTRLAASKGSTAETIVSSYFSYSANATVEVYVADDWVQDIVETSASEYQPPLVEEESAAAVSLAKSWMQANGYSSFTNLEAYTILTFPEPSDRAFFDTRVAYVSFHENVNARPEFLVWVDLSKKTVIKAEEAN